MTTLVGITPELHGEKHPFMKEIMQRVSAIQDF